VLKVLPHAHKTRNSLYAGWIAAFMVLLDLFSESLILKDNGGIQQWAIPGALAKEAQVSK
jgi:hypothetical protein